MRNLILTALALFLAGCPMQPGAEGEGTSPLTALIPFVLIFLVFYFLILRPQQRQSRKRQEMLSNIKRGDNVITAGGIYGKVLNIVGDVITLEIAKGINVRVSRSGISGFANQDVEEKKAKEEKS